MPDIQTLMGINPPDLSGQFNTQLSSEDEAAFQKWLRLLPARLQSVSDYDLRGAWKNNAKEAANGHLPDTWKKPNHPTFSRESVYSNAQNGIGGQWTDGSPQTQNDAQKNWVYWASPANARYRAPATLADYFARVEPNSTVVLPINYDLGKR